MKNELFSQLIALFLITQLLGLSVGWQLIPQEEVRAVVINENPEDPVNTVALIAWILVMTGVMLLLIKFLTGFWLYVFFKLLESLAVFGTSLIVFGSLVPDLIAVLILSLSLVLLRVFRPANLWLRNVASVIAVAGVGALIGVSFGIMPVVVFMVLLAFYDLIAVFKTRHMVTLAKAITQKNLSFTFALPTKEHVFELGTGDMVVPLTFGVAVLAATKASLPFELRIIPAAAVLVASLIGLVWTIHFSSKNIGRALPALPPQTVLMLLTYSGLYFLNFF